MTFFEAMRLITSADLRHAEAEERLKPKGDSNSDTDAAASKERTKTGKDFLFKRIWKPVVARVFLDCGAGKKKPYVKNEHSAEGKSARAPAVRKDDVKKKVYALLAEIFSLPKVMHLLKNRHHIMLGPIDTGGEIEWRPGSFDVFGRKKGR